MTMRTRRIAAKLALIGTTLIAFHMAPSQASAADVIKWGECPPVTDGFPNIGKQECALIPVPLDYRAPNGRKINIAISRIKADSGKRRGVLLLNPGGPGGAGLDFPRLAITAFPRSVVDAYDLMGFDPRGVGRSAPISCGLTADQSFQAIPQLEQNHSFDTTAAFARSVADACAGAASDRLPFMTSANTARDMDRIRAALGEEKMSYFAWSYGTYLGAVYASLFPQRTDRFVLDSSVNPDWIWRPQFRSWGAGAEARFPDFAAYAVANENTLHLGHTPDEVRGMYFELLTKTDTNPITFGGLVVNGPVFRVLNLSFLENDANFPAMASLWQAIRDSSGGTPASKGLAPSGAFPAVPPDNQEMSGAAILCDDVAWPRSVAQYRRELQSDEQKYPLFGQLGSHIWACAFWRTEPIEPPVTLTSNGPAHNILILNTLRDPITPLPGARRMREVLGERARLVLVDAGGHAIFGLMDNMCATQTVADYLTNGNFPSADTTCPANPVGTTAEGEQAAAREQARQAAPRRMKPLH
jgi:pimeloyl-ACP methyl ester carboxylesterase